MDAFGEDYIVHNQPLLFLSGLGVRDRSQSDVSTSKQTLLNEGGFRLRTDLPPIDGSTADHLRTSFFSHDGSEAPWKSHTTSSQSPKHFKIRSVGRTFSLPPRKAPPPAHSPRLSAIDRSDGAPPPLILHSPLSPLTPSSPLYPDGIMTPLWITKHQTQLPSALLVFFTLTTDSNTSSLLDNKIKTEISNIKSVLASTNYKTRLVVVLLADDLIDEFELGDRLGNIRKATGIDKNLHFLPSDVSPAHIADFVQSLLSSLYQQCIDYYRDLSKHARRKRNRNTIPQPTILPSDGRPLPAPGWVARYEFKLGVFAELRQEMDAACRNYEAAYESLLSPEMIDSVIVWTPRFNEARLLSDVIAVRILRCLMWNGQTTSAVRTWTSHRDRTRELIDRRGRGTGNYDWEAWQTTWTKTMADLLSRSDQSALTVRSTDNQNFASIFAGPEKSLPVGERMVPWENLSHQGYWLEIAQKHTQRRREFALQLPPEERQLPSPSAQSNDHETYLTLRPHQEMPINSTNGFDHIGEVISLLEKADVSFEERGQVLMREILGLKIAWEHIKREAWTEAASILMPLWKDQNWRRTGWWKLLQHVGWALLDCATHLQDAESILRLKWELCNAVFSEKPGFNDALQSSLQGLPRNESRPEFVIDAQDAALTISSSFAFASGEGYVGEPLHCQFTIQSSARRAAQDLRLTEAKILFDGSLKTIYVRADVSGPSAAEAEMTSVSLQETPRSTDATNKRLSVGGFASVSGEANLTLTPGQTRVFNLQVIPREAGEVSVESIILMIEDELFTLAIKNTDFDTNHNCWWETRRSLPMRREIGPSRDVSKVQVLPKPPKVEIQAKTFSQAYYTNEVIQLDLDIFNNEEEAVTANVEARLISPMKDAARIKWTDGPATEVEENEGTMQSLPSKSLSTIEPDSTTTVALSIFDTITALDHELEVAVTYTLSSDRESILRKVLTLDIVVIRPFEANYDFTPKLNPQPWPSFFSPPTPPEPSQPPIAQGLIQHFLVTANLVSFATSPLTIEGILLTSTKVTGGAVASSTTGIPKSSSTVADADEKISAPISPEQTLPFNFSLSVQKLVLGDRHTVSLDLALEIAWRRSGADIVHTTTLEVPRFVVPMAEPRVLVTASKSQRYLTSTKQFGSTNTDAAATATPHDMYTMKYTIENPSMHFLTFNVGMESSEEFAFSGMKARAVSVVPCSRTEVGYRLLPVKGPASGSNGSGNAKKKDEKWVRVQLNVVDAYFNQTLRVQPAVGMGAGVIKGLLEGVADAGQDEERVKLDKKGGVVLLVD